MPLSSDDPAALIAAFEEEGFAVRGVAHAKECVAPHGPTSSPLLIARRSIPSAWHFLYKWLRSSPSAFAVSVMR